MRVKRYVFGWPVKQLQNLFNRSLVDQFMRPGITISFCFLPDGPGPNRGFKSRSKSKPEALMDIFVFDRCRDTKNVADNWRYICGKRWQFITGRWEEHTLNHRRARNYKLCGRCTTWRVWKVQETYFYFYYTIKLKWDMFWKPFKCFNSWSDNFGAKVYILVNDCKERVLKVLWQILGTIVESF